MSGLVPGVILRNTFISESSPNATEEFDCSPLNRVEWVSRSSSWPGSRWNSSGPSGGASNERSQQAIASRSCTASYTWQVPKSSSAQTPTSA